MPRRTVEGTRLEGKNQFRFRQVKFKMPTRHPSGNVKQAVTYLSPEFKRERESERCELQMKSENPQRREASEARHWRRSPRHRVWAEKRSQH